MLDLDCISTGQRPLEHPVITGPVSLLSFAVDQVLGRGKAKMNQTQSHTQRAEGQGPWEKPR